MQLWLLIQCGTPQYIWSRHCPINHRLIANKLQCNKILFIAHWKWQTLKISKYFIAFHLLHFHRILIAIFQYVRISLQLDRIQKNLFICNLFAIYCNKYSIKQRSDFDHQIVSVCLRSMQWRPDPLDHGSDQSKDNSHTN